MNGGLVGGVSTFMKLWKGVDLYFFNNNPEYRLSYQGYRTDYFLADKSLLPYVKNSEILTDIFETTNNPILWEIDLHH